MSQEAVNTIIGMAATDSDFRKKLQENTDEVLKNYDLTDDEKDALKKMNFESLDKFAGDLDERISKRLRYSTVGG